MKLNEQQKITERIEQEIKTTSSKIAEYTSISQPISPDNAIGRVSRMDAINNKSIVDSALRKAKEKLKNLKLVKEAIKNSDFGLCIRCKKPIPIERLIIVPESRSCVHCA